jgi:hypothetical protein
LIAAFFCAPHVSLNRSMFSLVFMLSCNTFTFLLIEFVGIEGGFPPPGGDGQELQAASVSVIGSDLVAGEPSVQLLIKSNPSTGPFYRA